MKKAAISLSIFSIIFFEVLPLHARRLAITDIITQDSSIGRMSREPLKVGMSPGFSPFEFKNEKGEWEGFDVDIAKELAKSLGTELKIVETNWEELFNALNIGDIDVIISGMSITLDRAKQIYFTNPYFVTGQTILIKRNRFVDLNKKDAKIGVLTESTGEKIALKKFPQARIITFPSEDNVLSALLKDEVLGMIIDKIYAYNVVQKDNRIDILIDLVEIEKYAFAVQRGDFDFLFYLNHFIDYIKYTGRHQEIYDKWFGAKGNKTSGK